jgi:hypothetical protein
MNDMFQRVPAVRVITEESAVPFIPHGPRVFAGNPSTNGGGGSTTVFAAPTHVFLIYIKELQPGHWIARHMLERNASNVATSAANLFDLAKNNVATPYKVGENLARLIWDSPCYLYLVIDMDNHDFIESTFPELDPIQFHGMKPILDSNPPRSRHFDPNHAFYDGELVPLGGRTAFRCINYLTDEFGKPLKYPQVRTYGFELCFKAPWPTGPRPHKIDPDGQNQGPPSFAADMVTVPV